MIPDVKQKIKKALENDPRNDIVHRVSLFGSYLHGAQTPTSDVDLLIEFKPHTKIGFFEFTRIQRRISDAVGKQVDLLTPEAISIYFRDKVLQEAELIYEG